MRRFVFSSMVAVLAAALSCPPLNSQPPARHRHAMAGDPVRGEFVLFGGLDSNGNDLGDTWELDGVWVLR